MSGKLALDTDVSIKFLNGDTAIEAMLLKYSDIYLPVIVVGELIFGALNSKHAEQNLARHRRLIHKSRIVGITETTATTYAKLRLGLKKKGRPIPENDLWIASLCVENKIPLLSNDGHFEHIDQLHLLKIE